MCILIDKSKINIASAQILINNQCYAPSVHCSYYSSVQLMIEVLYRQCGYTKESLEKNAKNESSGSHIYAKKVLFEKMDSKNERLKAVDFQRIIGKLKNKREQADYHEIIIDCDFSREALDQAKRVNEIISEIFSLKV